jgi:uroporphyrinogen decarboxylase
MTSQERVRKAIHFDYPDRPPISHAILPSALLHHGDALRAILKDVHEDFGWDLLPDLPVGKFPPYYRKGRNKDGFGVIWESSEDGEYGLPVVKPLADWSAYESFVWPDFPVQPPKYRLYSGHMVGKDPRWYSRGGWITFFETMQELRGFEDLLADIVMGEDAAFVLRDAMLDFNLAHGGQVPGPGLRRHPFCRRLGHPDCLDDKSRVMAFLLQALLQDHVRKGPGSGQGCPLPFRRLHHRHHPGPDRTGSLGHQLPVQLHGQHEVGRRFKGKICFRTDVDRQNVMTFGKPADVKKHIGNLFRALGSGKGGIIACGEIGRDTPWTT